MTIKTIWTYEEVGHTQSAKREIKELNFDLLFDTPKPEKLIERILQIATNEGDFALDSFLGSGTTTAVAHKMKRKWIGVKLGKQHPYTHAKLRLDKVIDGEQGGISKEVNWEGGGGYKFYELAPTLINLNKFGAEVISRKYNPEMLAAAMCLHMDYEYAPDEEVFFKQGKRGEKNFIFTTTNLLTSETLTYIHNQLTKDEHLLICATAFISDLEHKYGNIVIKKIPNLILGKCEYGKTNYNLNIVEKS